MKIVLFSSISLVNLGFLCNHPPFFAIFNSYSILYFQDLSIVSCFNGTFKDSFLQFFHLQITFSTYFLDVFTFRNYKLYDLFLIWRCYCFINVIILYWCPIACFVSSLFLPTFNISIYYTSCYTQFSYFDLVCYIISSVSNWTVIFV